jgi:hypothetical protein
MNVCKIRNQSTDVGEVCATRYCVCKIEEVCVAKKTGEIVITLKERSPAFVQKSKVVVCKKLAAYSICDKMPERNKQATLFFLLGRQQVFFSVYIRLSSVYIHAYKLYVSINCINCITVYSVYNSLK